MAEDTNSVLVSFSALNVYQNRELNPDAPEFIPFHHHHQHHRHHHAAITNSSAFIYQPPLVTYTLLPTLTPPPPPPQPQTVFYYFQPLMSPTPFAQFFPQVQTRQQLTWCQPIVDQLHVAESESGRGSTVGNGRSRRCGGRLGQRRVSGVWRVKSGRSSNDPNRGFESASDLNRVTLTSSINHCQERNQDEDSSEYRVVKYRACRKIGKKFEIQPVEKTVSKTTVMIRNIPSRYTRDMMLTFLDRHCMEVNQMLNQSCSTDDNGCFFSAYDFFYMPIDFKSGLNKSYAFVNFTTSEAVWRFNAECDNQKWEMFESNKIRQIALAKLQGTRELIEHFERTAFACHCDEFLPVYFQPPRDGRADVDRVTSIIGKRVN